MTSTRLLKVVAPILILGLAVLVSLYMLGNRKEQVQTRSQTAIKPTVSVLDVQLGTVPVSITAYGNVTAWRQLDLYSQVTGKILWQSPAFEPGELVEQGQTLLRIDPTDYKLALAEARQALSSGKLSLADAKSLKQAARVDEAEATVAAAQARIARAERDLDNTEVTAPFRAVVDEQAVEFGQYVTLGMQLGRILGSDRAEIRLSILPQDRRFLMMDADVEVTLTDGFSPQFPAPAWQGRVTRIESRVDPQTRVTPVVVTVEQPLDTKAHHGALLFGQFVRVAVTGGQLEDAIVIPQSALHGENDVFLLVDGALQRRSVNIVRLDDEGALIQGGLNPGDQVVVTRLELMFEGMQVTRG